MVTLNLFLLLTLFSLASSCSSGEDVVEQSVISIENILDHNGEWETIVTNNLDPSLSPNNSNVEVKRKLVDKDGKRRMIVTVSLKGNFNHFSWGALRFHSEGARNIKVYNDGTFVKKVNGKSEEGYGGLLTNRPLQDNELFQVKIEKLLDKYSTSLGIGVTRFDLKNTEYTAWMMCGTKMLYNNQLYESGSVTKKDYGPNLRKLTVGDRVGVMKKSNGDLHFFVNGMDLGVAASGITHQIYGVLDLYGNAVEASLA